MDKDTAYKNLENCFSHYESFDHPEVRKAIVLNDQALLDKHRKQYMALMAKKEMYIKQVKDANSPEEVAKIIGSVNLSDILGDY